MDDLLEEQKAEQEECEAKIAKLKAQLGSASKKKAKAIKFDLALAEGQLEYLLQTHEDQRDELGGGDGGSSDGGGDDPAAAASQSKQAAVEPEPEPEPAGPVQQGGNGGGGSGGGGKKSKAQKRREKKEREEKERAVRIAKVDPKKGESMKEVEYAQIKEILTPLKGIIMPIKPDGHCMFRAVTSQCEGESAMDVEGLRAKTAAHLRAHKEDFAPFLTNDKGDCMSDAEFEAYCTGMGSQAVWGGECELKAISSILKRPIRVFQSHGGVRVIGDELEGDAILLSYHRHEFSLGEHYNAVRVCC